MLWTYGEVDKEVIFVRSGGDREKGETKLVIEGRSE